MRSLVISGLMLLMLSAPAAAEPFRLSAVEADQVTAGSGFVVPGKTVAIKVVLDNRTLVDKTLKLPERGKLVLSKRGKLVLITDKGRRQIASGVRGKKLILSAGGHNLVLKHRAGKERLVLVRACSSNSCAVVSKHAGFVSVKNKGGHAVARSVVDSDTGGGVSVVQSATAVATAKGARVEAVTKYRN